MPTWCQLTTIALGLLMTAIYAAASEELLELSCLDSQQCKQFEHADTNASCVENHCQCFKIATEERIKCQPKDLKQNNIIGGPCPCQFPHAQCNKKQDICYCALRFMPSTDRRRCVRREVDLNKACEMDIQCRSHYSECNQEKKKCLCKTGFEEHLGVCAAVVDPNFNCTSEVECLKYGLHAECNPIYEKCICSESHVAAANQSICLPNAIYQRHCNEHLQCKKKLGRGGVCRGNVCLCDNQHVAFDQSGHLGKRIVCEPVVQRGQYCLVTEDCFQLNVPAWQQTMQCIYGECTCRWGSFNNSVCLKVGSSMNLKANTSLLLILAAILKFAI